MEYFNCLLCASTFYCGSKILLVSQVLVLSLKINELFQLNESNKLKW